MVDKSQLIKLGTQYGLLNWVDHETPRTYFVRPLDSYTDVDDPVELLQSIQELHILLRAIYEHVDIV